MFVNTDEQGNAQANHDLPQHQVTVCQLVFGGCCIKHTFKQSVMGRKLLNHIHNTENKKKKKCVCVCVCV